MKIRKHQEDYEDIRKVIEGDTNAFRQLVEKHKNVSLSLAFSILKDKSLAEDVLQDVFIKVFKKLKTFQFKAAFSTWLYRIVVNTAYNELKKQKSNVPLNETTPTDISYRLEQRDPLKAEDQKHFIHLALKRLRTDEALVLELFYLCELSLKEIKGVTGFTSSKIKTDLHRGRDNLGFQLKQLLGSDIKHLL